MIVWLASYPRSGNTFLRIVLNQLYGLTTSVVYPVDGVAERLGPEMIGFEKRTMTLDAMRESGKAHLVKTHRQRDVDVDAADRAICLVRDGRDALVSWARLITEDEPTRFEAELRALIGRDDDVGTGSWGQNVLSWCEPLTPRRVLLRYEDLVRDPAAVVDRAMAVVLPEARQLAGARVPSFAELRRIDNGFFRRGHTGTHRDEFPDDLHRLFWSRSDNVAAMALLGYSSE